MKDAQEIAVKVVIFFLVLILLLLEVLVVQVRIWRIIITFVILVLTVLIIIVERRKVEAAKRMCRAFIYQHKENRSIVYCENDEGDETRDFRKIGEGQVRCDLVSRCSFAR